MLRYDLTFVEQVHYMDIYLLLNLQYIHLGAFQNCTSLTSITLPENAMIMGGDVFHGCTNLNSIKIPKGIDSIPSGTFQGCTSLTSITLPKDITTIGENAFSGCTYLQSINIPAGVTKINDSTFYGCNSLKSITLPQGLTEIGKDAFHDCTSLTSIVFPEKIKSIRENSFRNCENITALTFQGYMDGFSIHDYAFQNCKKLESVRFEAGGGPSISAFEDCPLLHRKKLKTDEWWDWLIIQDFRYSGSDDSMNRTSVSFSRNAEKEFAWITGDLWDVLYYNILWDGKIEIKLLDRKLRNMGIILYSTITIDSETGELWYDLRERRWYFKN